MEKKNVKKRSFGSKVKRSLKRLIRKIVLFFKNLYKKFMDLPKKVRMILGVWTVVVVLIVVVIIAGSVNNNFLNKYKSIEKVVNEAALQYVKDNKIYPMESNKLKLDINALVDNGYLTKKDINDNTCEGFSVIYAKGDVTIEDELNAEFNINTYINCDKYTTEGYNDYK